MNADRAPHRRTVEWTRFVKAFGTLGAESLAAEAYRDPGLRPLLYAIETNRGSGGRWGWRRSDDEDCCRRSNFYQNFYQNRVYGPDPPGRIRRPGHAESQVRQQMREPQRIPLPGPVSLRG